ncbi:MAG: hypothetical protein JXB88_00755 [Spirochaetales bacterium]|nr:hypothetical protein [Spirochaetales bacterium]
MNAEKIDGTYIFDESLSSYGNFFKAGKILVDITTAYQKILIMDTSDAGRIMFLDNDFNVSTIMESFYHEPMAHIPLAMVNQKENILIIGGGDFGVASHVLKHKDVRHLVMCEIDEQVVQVCRRYFPDWAGKAEGDPRFSLVIGDGIEFVKKPGNKAKFDAVIIDSTDPFSSARGLIAESFYADVKASMKPDGVLIQIGADTVIYKKLWLEMIPNIRKHFPFFYPLLVPIPFYVTGAWGLVIAGSEESSIDPARVTGEYINSIGNVKTITPDMVKGWFSLPPYFKEYISGVV